HRARFAKLPEHRAKCEADIEGLLRRRVAFRQRLENVQRLLKPDAGVRQRRSRGRLCSRLTQIEHSLLLELAPDRGVRRLVALFIDAVGVERFYGVHDEGVDLATTIAQHSAVGDVMCEGMLESELQVGKKLCGVEKLGILQIPAKAAELVIAQAGNRLEQSHRNLVSDDRRLLEEALLGGREGIDARSEHRL